MKRDIKANKWVLFATSAFLLVGCKTTILKSEPPPYMIDPGAHVYVENDGRCSYGEVIRVIGGNATIGRKYECVQNPNEQMKGNVLSNHNSGKTNRHAVAVIVGNQNYSQNNTDVPNVEFAGNDAEAIKNYVISFLGYREGNVILLKDATQAEMVSTFGNHNTHRGKLNNWVRPDISDVFVFYSGHGAPGLNSGQGYLLPVDADPMTVELNGYSLETLYSNLAKIPTKSMTVVIDACFSGSSQNGTLVKNASSIALRRVELNNKIPNAAILTASNINEVASWDKKASLGLFTKHFLEGATGEADSDDFGNGDGKVTLGELKKYLESEVTYMARRLYNRDQNPQVTGDPERVLAATN